LAHKLPFSDKERGNHNGLERFPRLGTKTFAELIEENLFYADKTKFIYELARGPNAEFSLYRPRRFIKSPCYIP
jgi:hypothetical protein